MPQEIKSTFLTFSEGLIDSMNPIMKDPNSLQKMDDWSMSEEFEGSIVLSDPATLLWTPTDGTLVSSIHSATDSSGNSFIYTVVGTVLKQATSAGGSPQNVKTGLTADKPASMAVMADAAGTITAFFCNGTDTPFKTAVSSTPSASNIGLTRPDVTNASTSVNGSGDVKGTVKYFISQMSGSPATTEGALSLAFGEIDAQDGSTIDVDLTHGDFGANTYRLYRTTANRHSPRYVATVTGGTTYSDTTLDSSLGDVPFVHGDPPPTTSSLFISHLNRLWAVDGTTVYFSDVGQPESFFTGAIGNSFKVGPEDGEDITGIAVDSLGLLLLKKNHIYRLLGKKEDEFEVVDLTSFSSSSFSGVGIQGFFSYVSTPEGVFFLRSNRLYKISGFDVEQIHSFGKNLNNTCLGYQPLRNNLYISGSLAASTQIYSLGRGRFEGVQSQPTGHFAGIPDGNLVGFGTFGTGTDDNIYTFPLQIYIVSTSSSSDTFSQDVETSRFYANDPSSIKRFLWADAVTHLSDSKNAPGPTSARLQVNPVVDGSSLTSVTLQSGITRIPINQEGYHLTFTLESLSPTGLPGTFKPIVVHGFKVYWVDIPKTVLNPP